MGNNNINKKHMNGFFFRFYVRTIRISFTVHPLSEGRHPAGPHAIDDEVRDRDEDESVQQGVQELRKKRREGRRIFKDEYNVPEVSKEKC
ncbi:hypothetical protein ES707_18305 [subsurface metagenome]